MTPLLYKYVQRFIGYFPNEREREKSVCYNVLLYTRIPFLLSHPTLRREAAILPLNLLIFLCYFMISPDAGNNKRNSRGKSAP